MMRRDESKCRPGIQVMGTGLTVLDRIYTRSNGERASEELGGSCGNVLLSLAMLERAVAPVLSLGDDEVGCKLIDAFAAAGAETAFIERRPGARSPVIVEFLDELSGEHSFGFQCPETNEEFPRYEPIGNEEVRRALPSLEGCSVFYADRISETIVDAMEAASAAGVIVYFEPSSIHDNDDLSLRAVRASSVLKFSHDRIAPEEIRRTTGAATICIATFGAAGLEISQGSETMWCEADQADVVRDTCGSGDMVSVGIIDWLVQSSEARERKLRIEAIVDGVKAGQRLAAANCAFVGARGLFRERGAAYARSILEELTIS